MPTFWRVFIINGCWILSNAFSASLVKIIWFLFVSLLMWCITLIDLWMVKNPCIPGINPTWSWCIALLMYCCIWFARICWVFLPLSSSVMMTVIFFFCSIFVWFWYQSNAGLIEWVGECSFFFILESLRRLDISSLNVC